MINKLFKLAARPVGMAKRTDFSYEEVPVAEPKDGELLVKIHYISLDPAMRGWMNAGKSYIRPVEIGEIMRAGTVGEVIASRNAQFQVGDFVSGNQGVWQLTTLACEKTSWSGNKVTPRSSARSAVTNGSYATIFTS